MQPPPREQSSALNADSLQRLLRQRFRTLADPRPAAQIEIRLVDALLSGFALFALKDPSLLAFDQRRHDPSRNLQAVFGIQRIPCDTQMRQILDPVDPEQLRPAFTDVFRALQRGKALESYVYYQGCYLLSLDGTEYFSSHKIHCPSCCSRTNKNGDITYYHQALGACLVHPDHKEVIPLMPEPIGKQDGAKKNDCERNAAKRFLRHFRTDHPQLPVIVVEDALSANAPHIRELQSSRCHFILGVKPGDHSYLFAQMEQAFREGRSQQATWVDDRGTIHHFRWLNNVALNESNPDVVINMLEYWEIRDGEIHYFSWVTDFVLVVDNVWIIMRGGRSRWKIENETFNTLKNQGYHFEHNFGHGEQQLSVVLMVLMLLAFLVDQVQQLCNVLFQAAWAKLGSKRRLWERQRSLFEDYQLTSLQELYQALACGIVPQPVQLQAPDSS
jgi:hypothetical protein